MKNLEREAKNLRKWAVRAMRTRRIKTCYVCDEWIQILIEMVIDLDSIESRFKLGKKYYYDFEPYGKNHENTYNDAKRILEECRDVRRGMMYFADLLISIHDKNPTAGKLALEKLRVYDIPVPKKYRAEIEELEGDEIQILHEFDEEIEDSYPCYDGDGDDDDDDDDVEDDDEYFDETEDPAIAKSANVVYFTDSMKKAQN